jgi:hypothetical protein
MSDEFCTKVSIDIEQLSGIALHKARGHSGASIASYRQVEATAILSNKLGLIGLEHGVDYIWDGFFLDEVTLLFKNEQAAFMVKMKW